MVLRIPGKWGKYLHIRSQECLCRKRDEIIRAAQISRPCPMLPNLTKNPQEYDEISRWEKKSWFLCHVRRHHHIEILQVYDKFTPEASLKNQTTLEWSNFVTDSYPTCLEFLIDQFEKKMRFQLNNKRKRHFIAS